MIKATKSSLYYKAPRQLNNRYSSIEPAKEEDSSCPVCGSTNFKYYPSYNQTLCECGCVIEEDNIDKTVNGLNYGDSGCITHSFTTKSATLHDGGLTTSISKSNRDSNGKYVPNAHNLRKTESRNRVNGNKERNLTSANEFLLVIKSHLSLQQYVIDEAARFYKVALEAKEIQGRSIEDMVAASVFLACKSSYPRSAKEISAVTKVKRGNILKYSKVIKKHVNVKHHRDNPNDFIPRFVGGLEFPEGVIPGLVEAEAIRLIGLLSDKQLGNGTQPSSYATAAIYIACRNLKIKMVQKRIVKVTGVSETALRNRCRDIKAVMV